MKHYTNHSLKEFHTFGMDVRAAHLVEYASVDELCALLEKLRGEWKGLPYLHIGGSCVNCLRTNDESYYLSLQDKKINQVSEQVQKKYLKN